MAVDSAPESILLIDARGVLCFANRKAVHDLGVTEKDLFHTHISRLFPELDDKRLAQIRHRAKTDGRVTLECRRRGQGLHLIPTETRLGLLQDGADEYLSLFVRNIVARNEAERLLQLVARTTSRTTEEDFFRTLVRSLAEALDVRMAFVSECLDRPATRVRTLSFWCDNAFANNLEYDLAGTPCDIVINENRVCHYPERLEDIFIKERGFGVKSYLGVPILNAAETRVIGHIAILDAHEMPENYYIQTAFDIICSRAGAEMERMQVTRDLRSHEEKYRLLVENQQELVAQLDYLGTLVFVSPSLCEQFGRTERHLLGKAFQDLIEELDHDVSSSSWEKLKQQPHQSSFEHLAQTTKGQRWIEWSQKASLDDIGNIKSVVCVGRDVTDRHTAEEQALQTLLDLAHLSRLNSMGEMASALAHEINQPLCAILSFSQACRRMMMADQIDFEDLRHAIDRMAVNAELAGNIIKQMRGYVQKGDAKREFVDPVQLVQETLNLAQTEVKDSPLRIELDAVEPLPPIHVNVIQIQQVILNLLRNANEAISQTGGNGRIGIEIRQLTPTKLQLSIDDTGPGIADDLLERLFDPFVSSKQEGIGIGLSICKSIIESHGGSISAFNQLHAGACFRIILPHSSPRTHEYDQ